MSPPLLPEEVAAFLVEDDSGEAFEEMNVLLLLYEVSLEGIAGNSDEEGSRLLRQKIRDR